MLVKYVNEGQKALLYFNRCHDTGHVPSVPSLQSLELTVVEVHKASKALQVRESFHPRLIKSCTVFIVSSVFSLCNFWGSRDQMKSRLH